jgi:hypothetical protein
MNEDLIAAEPTESSLSDVREGSPARLHRRLRGDLDTIVLRAMHKEAARRYASVEQFSEDLRRHMAGLPLLRGGIPGVIERANSSRATRSVLLPQL